MNSSSRLIAFIFLCFSFSLDAQQLITSYSVDQGLPQSTVTALYRDNEGYLWCGTGAGLGIYDGWTFHKPTSNPEKPNPSLNSSIRGIIPSNDGKTIWVGTETSVNQFDRYNYSILRSFDLVKFAGAQENPAVANDTAVWVVCAHAGMYRVRLSDGKSSQLTTSGYVGSCLLLNDQKTVVFADSLNEIMLYDILANTKLKVKIPLSMTSYGVMSFHSLPGTSSEFLMFTARGIWKIEIGNGKISRYFLNNAADADSTLSFITMDVHPDGSWWLAARNKGVYRYDPKSFELRPCKWQQDGTFMGKPMLSPTKIICDAFGVVWCGTDGGGLQKLLHGRIMFHEKFTEGVITDTCNWFTRCFYELSSDKYLVGTYQHGLQLIDRKKNTVSNVATDELWTNRNPLFITESGDGRLLIGTDRGVLLMDTVRWETTEVDVGNAAGSKFLGCVQTASGKILVYGNMGMREYLPGTSPALSAAIVGADRNVTCAKQLADGRILVAQLYEGISELDANMHQLRNYGYEHDLGMPSAIDIKSIYDDPSGMIWLGSQSGIYQLQGMKLVHIFTVADGLPDNTVYAIEGIDKSHCVFATGHGVVIYDLNSKTCTVYNSADGLPSDECNSGALMMSRAGMMYVGTTAGFVRFHPGEKSNCFRSASILASFTDDGYQPAGIIRESIIRDYGSSTVELNIWQTDFSFPSRVVFEYQLEGSGEQSRKETGLRKVTYASLGSGFYSFICSVTIPGCEKSAITKLLTIKIVPPFWMSGWFIGITSMGIILLITLILFAVMRMNYQRKLRKLKMQQELDKVRQRISRDIHDEIGAGLTRIALSGDLMSQKIARDDVQYEKLKVIAGTARELSQSMKEVVWSVNPHYDNLDHMAAYFRSYVSGVAENADLRFVYKADEKWPDLEVNPETRRNLLLILKESISNAVKYSHATELRLELHWSNKQFSMSIADNGKGFNLQAAEGVNSNGLRNIRQRAEASGCIATITSTAQGTTIHIVGSIEKI
jgi:signal transduction histidine kinase/ligand-binding sensor domain-containing protein